MTSSKFATPSCSRHEISQEAGAVLRSFPRLQPRPIGGILKTSTLALLLYRGADETAKITMSGPRDGCRNPCSWPTSPGAHLMTATWWAPRTSLFFHVPDVCFSFGGLESDCHTLRLQRRSRDPFFDGLAASSDAGRLASGARPPGRRRGAACQGQFPCTLIGDC